VQDVEAALRAEIALLVKDGVKEDELKRVKAQVMAGEVYKLDSVFYQAMQIGQLESIGLGYQAIPVMLEKLQAVTAEQVQQVAKEFLQDDNLTVAVLGSAAAFRQAETTVRRELIVCSLIQIWPDRSALRLYAVFQPLRLPPPTSSTGKAPAVRRCCSWKIMTSRCWMLR